MNHFDHTDFLFASTAFQYIKTIYLNKAIKDIRFNRRTGAALWWVSLS